MDAFSDAMDVIFADTNMAKAATYTPPSPPGAAAIPCKIILAQQDRDLELSAGGQVHAAGIAIEFRRSEISNPERGGKFAIGERLLTILDAPRTDDPDRLIWKCRAK